MYLLKNGAGILIPMVAADGKRTNRCVSRIMVKSSHLAMTRIPAVEALR